MLIWVQQRGVWVAFPVPHRDRVGPVHRDVYFRSIGRYHPVGPALPGQEPLVRLQRADGSVDQCSLLESASGQCFECYFCCFF